MSTWIFPANPNDFEIESAFLNLKDNVVDWGTKNKVKIGDSIYFYKSIGKNNLEGRIILKTEVIRESVPVLEVIDDRKYWLRRNFDLSKKHIRVKLIGKIYNDDISSKLSYNNLKKNGLRSTLMGPIILDNNPQLKAYVENILKDN